MAQKLVLLCIADHANKDGENAFPGIERIAAECCMGRATVIRNIESLVELGCLVRQRRIGGDGGGARSNLYSLPLSESITERSSRKVIAKVSLSTSESITLIPEPSVNRKINRKSAKAPVSFPKGLNVPAWEKWIDYRRKSRFRAYSTSATMDSLASYPEPVQQEAIDNSIVQGWQGLFPEKIRSTEQIPADDAGLLAMAQAKGLHTRGKTAFQLRKELQERMNQGESYA